MRNQVQLRPRRIFSEEVKRHAVELIESGKRSALWISRDYAVSYQAVYKWISKYSRHLQQGKIIILQMETEIEKTAALKKQIQELQAALGRKQMEVDFLNRLIEQGKEELNIDLKKKFSTPPSTGSGVIKGNIATK